MRLQIKRSRFFKVSKLMGIQISNNLSWVLSLGIPESDSHMIEAEIAHKVQGSGSTRSPHCQKSEIRVLWEDSREICQGCMNLLGGKKGQRLGCISFWNSLYECFSYKFIIMRLKMKVKSLSRVRLFATPWTAASQAPSSMGFSRQEYWSGLPFPSGDLPNPGIEPRSPAL